MRWRRDPGFDWAAELSTLVRWQEKGALTIEQDRVALTEQGRWFINDIVADFMAD